MARRQPGLAVAQVTGPLIRRRAERVVGSENEAFAKLIQACRHAQEAAREIGVRRADDRWSRIGLAFEGVEQTARKLFEAGRLRLLRD